MTLNNGDTILVAGATGQQGGAVVDALIESGQFRVRALTRDAGSEKAKAIAAKGAEVVQGDLDDRSATDTALAGARGVFLDTGPDGTRRSSR